MKGSILFLIASIITGFYILAQTGTYGSESRSNQEILDELDGAIKNRQSFIDGYTAQADSLKGLINSTNQPIEKVRLSFEAADIYSHIDKDSAIAVLNRGYDWAISINDSISAERFIILRAKERFFRGLIHESQSDIDLVRQDGIHPHNWLAYHNTCAIIYTTLSQFNNYGNVDKDLGETGISHARLEMALLSKNDPSYHLAEALVNLNMNDMDKMSVSLENALRLMGPDHEFYYKAHTLLGEYHLRANQIDKAIHHFGLSATQEIRRSLLYEVALLRLGETLALDGDFTRAYGYLRTSFDNTLRSNSKFNLMRVNDAYAECMNHIEQSRNERYIGLVIAVIVLIVMLMVIVKLVIDKRNEVKSLRTTEKLLAKSNLAKDTYIGEFMNLCSVYMENLEEYNKMCLRKISTGQTDSLLAYIKSGTVLEEQRRKFYEVFDNAFLVLFPNFVDDVNRLLLPDRQFPAGSDFNTELRILALTRLGIEDSNTISRFLGISTNTIYTYRNKMRSRAIDRATFDNDIKHIDTV